MDQENKEHEKTTTHFFPKTQYNVPPQRQVSFWCFLFFRSLSLSHTHTNMLLLFFFCLFLAVKKNVPLTACTKAGSSSSSSPS